jgi:glutathione S-transferase
VLLYDNPVSGNCYKVRLILSLLGIDPLAESNAILWFFADGTRYLPDDPYERARYCNGCVSGEGKYRGAMLCPLDAYRSGDNRNVPIVVM